MIAIVSSIPFCIGLGYAKSGTDCRVTQSTLTERLGDIDFANLCVLAQRPSVMKDSLRLHVKYVGQGALKINEDK